VTSAKTSWVDTPERISEIADKLKKKKMIGIDTEFIRETTFFPKIALIQVATDEESWLVDPTVLKAPELEPLFEVLRDPSIMKIMHAAYSDQECFYTAYGFLLSPLLDTSIGAALCGLGDNLGLGRLLKEMVGVHLPKGRARARWLQRPLSQELKDYAEQDVAHLSELGEKLTAKLKSVGRYEWALEESVIPASVFDCPPEETAQKMVRGGQVDPANYHVFRELVTWRENRARKADLPRGWIADNETLVALSRVKPRSLDELRSFRGLSPKEVDRSGQYILESIARGKEHPREEFARVNRLPPRTEREDHVIDLIHSYVAYLASHHQIANRFLLSSNRSYLLLLHAGKSSDEWVSEGILSPHAAKLIGTDLKFLLEGKRGLSIKNGKVEILELKA